MNWTALDDAIASNLQHGAMAGADPLVDSLYGPLESPAAEGAQPASTAGSGLTAQQRAALAEATQGLTPWRWMLATAALAMLASWQWPLLAATRL